MSWLLKDQEGTAAVSIDVVHKQRDLQDEPSVKGSLLKETN